MNIKDGAILRVCNIHAMTKVVTPVSSKMVSTAVCSLKMFFNKITLAVHHFAVPFIRIC